MVTRVGTEDSVVSGLCRSFLDQAFRFRRHDTPSIFHHSIIPPPLSSQQKPTLQPPRPPVISLLLTDLVVLIDLRTAYLFPHVCCV